MPNKNYAKASSSSAKYAFMITAIASVLVLGTGYSSMQSFGTIGGLGLLTGATQSVECLASLTEKQQTNLFQELGVDNTEDAAWP